mgnify:CR=1 FL=1
MGYCIKLVSKKEIREDDVKSIIFKLPDYLKGSLNDIKEQEWGWPCVCDVNKPIGKELIISGSYAMSGDKAQDFTSYIQHALDELGYDVDIAYTDTVLFDEKISKDDKKIKLNPEINVHIPEVKLRDDYIDTAAKIAENLKDFNERTTTSFKHAAEAMFNFGVKAADLIPPNLIRNGLLKDSCSHCGSDMKEANTKYCEKCYQLLIAKNAELQLKVKRRIPEEDVILFMSKLRDLIIKPQTNKYDANDKLKDISELYLKYINKLGGIKYESND